MAQNAIRGFRSSGPGRLNWGHVSARGLVQATLTNELPGTVRELMTNGAGVYGTAPTLSGDPNSGGRVANLNSDILFLYPTGKCEALSTQVTMVHRIYVFSGQTGTSSCNEIATGGGASATVAFLYNFDTFVYQFSVNGFGSTTGTTLLDMDVWRTYVGRYSRNLLLDMTKWDDSGNLLDTQTGTAPNYNIANDGSGTWWGLIGSTNFDFGLIYNRYVSNAEISNLILTRNAFFGFEPDSMAQNSIPGRRAFFGRRAKVIR